MHGQIHGEPAGAGIRQPAGRRCKMRKFWLNIHLYIALAVGLVFVLLGLTGSINVFRWELDAWLNPKLQMAKPQGASRSLEDIVSAAKAAHPGLQGNWSLQLPGESSRMALVRCREQRPDQWFPLRMIWVEPQTAAVVSSRTFGDFFITWVYDLHWSLLMGKAGHVLVGVFGLVFLLSLGTGIYLWWPSAAGLRQALAIKYRASSQRLVFDLHKAVGLYTLPVTLVLAFSGTYLVFPAEVKSLVNWFSPIAPEFPQAASVLGAGMAPITTDQAVAVAGRVFPDGEPKWIALPSRPDGTYTVLMRRANGSIAEWFNKSMGASAVVVDQYSGKVLAVRDSNRRSAGESLLDVQWAFHYGEALGLPGRILWCVTGIVPLFLYVTGIIRWLQKRRAKRRAGIVPRFPQTDAA